MSCLSSTFPDLFILDLHQYGIHARAEVGGGKKQNNMKQVQCLMSYFNSPGLVLKMSLIVHTVRNKGTKLYCINHEAHFVPLVCIFNLWNVALFEKYVFERDPAS